MNTQSDLITHAITHIVGFGSQATAWAQCLRDSGMNVEVYLRSPSSPSFASAAALGFTPRLMPDLTKALLQNQSKSIVAFLCPDDQIANVYNEYCAQVKHPITFILAHGFAIYSEELKPRHPEHEIVLFAPKAIGPKIREAYLDSKIKGTTHALSAAVTENASCLSMLASGLRFNPTKLIPATFEQETIGDLISEQNLLCGGLFTLLELTMANMRKAGIPEALIHEECITELELIASLLREKGFKATFNKISQNAQAGALLQRESLLRHGVEKALQERVDNILNKHFVEELREPKMAELKGGFNEHLQ